MADKKEGGSLRDGLMSLANKLAAAFEPETEATEENDRTVVLSHGREVVRDELDEDEDITVSDFFQEHADTLDLDMGANVTFYRNGTIVDGVAKVQPGDNLTATVAKGTKGA